jgi:ABC-2 type transport system permease protein
MCWRRVSTIAAHEISIVWRQRFWFMALIGMPIVLMAFVKPVFGVAAEARGYENANGAEYAVPGMAVMFLFFLVGLVGMSFNNEYEWATWDRVRMVAGSAEIIIGKVLPFIAIALFQQTVLFTVGVLVFGLHIRGPIVALVPVAVCLALALVAFAMTVVAVTHSVQQLSIVQSLGTMLLAGLGGALTPAHLLPDWAKAISPVTPTYWALRGYRGVVLDGKGLSSVALPCAALLVFAVVFTAIAGARLRINERKVTFG